MPVLALLALLGLGFVFASSRTSAHGKGLNPADLAGETLVRTPEGILVATKLGAALALQRLLRYTLAPSSIALVIGGVPVDPTSPLGKAQAISGRKTYLGRIGVPGEAPIKIADTLVGWVQDRALEGKAVLLRDALFRPAAAYAVELAALPTSTELVAVDPFPPPDTLRVLDPLMAVGPGGVSQGWVLLGSPAVLAVEAGNEKLWPPTVAAFSMRAWNV